MVKVMYEDVYGDIFVGDLLTNQSLTVDQALDLIDFNPDKFMADHDFDDIDYNNFKLVYCQLTKKLKQLDRIVHKLSNRF